MILPFSQEINGKKTYFAEKIWKAIDVHKICSENDCIEYSNNRTQFLNLAYSKIESLNPKIHTIREDLKNRWKQGNKIHAVYNNRSKNQFQFVPTFICKSIQIIEIRYTNKCSNYPIILIDNQILHVFNKDDWKIIELLAKNDGFETVEEFCKWFHSDFKGKIIHFTDFKY